MSAERIPQPTPPSAPERPRLVLTEYAARPADAAQRLEATDRLFALCLIPAAGLIALVCAALGLADLGRTPRPSDRPKPMRLQWYRPPVPHTQKPHLPTPQRPAVPSRPRQVVTTSRQIFPPRSVPHPTTLRVAAPSLRSVPVLQAPTPTHVQSSPAPVSYPTAPRLPHPAPPVLTAPPAMSSGRAPTVVHTPRTGHVGPAFSATTTGPVNVPLAGGGSLQPTAPTQFAPEPLPPKPVQPPRTIEPPRVVEQPKPKPVEEPKPKPVEQTKPAHYVGSVDSREASVDDGSIQTPDADGIDASDISGSCVISFEVDENGHLSGVRVKKSCGSSEMDRRCADAVRHGHGVPAVQDHIAYRARGQYTFSL